MQEELKVKGIIISTAPQGEYGKRINLLTDRLGRITVFATGAAKAKSHVIGLIRPMTCAEFTLAKGRSAWNLRGAQLIEGFETLAMDVEASVYAAYVLEAADYFSESGMPEQEAKNLLNLIYVTLQALEKKSLEPEMVRRIYELRLLKLQGEYTETPEAEQDERVRALWQHALHSPLTKLYTGDVLWAPAVKNAQPPQVYPGTDEKYESAVSAFSDSVHSLFLRQVPHHFKSLDILREM